MRNNLNESNSWFDLHSVWEHFKFGFVLLIGWIASINPDTATKWVTLIAACFYMLNQAHVFINKSRRKK